MERQQIAVIEKLGDLINARLEEEIFKLLAPDTSMLKPMGRKAIGQKLGEEN